jgi:hypothetical protein
MDWLPSIRDFLDLLSTAKGDEGYIQRRNKGKKGVGPKGLLKKLNDRLSLSMCDISELRYDLGLAPQPSTRHSKQAGVDRVSRVITRETTSQADPLDKLFSSKDWGASRSRDSDVNAVTD